jgi:hypothetical protein
LTERLALTEAGIKVFEDVDWNEKRAATTGQGIMRILVCYEESLKEKKRSLSRQTSALGFVKSSSGTCTSPPVFWTLEMMRQINIVQFKRKCPL